MALEKLLSLRKFIKAKKPSFRRHDSHKKSSLSSSWRKPRGLQNKVRLGKKGYVKKVTQGYRSPSMVRGLDKNGLRPVLVSNLKELRAINPKEESVIIASKVGAKKRKALLEEAKNLKITVLNLKVDEAIAKIESSLKNRQDERVKRESVKAKKKAASKKAKKDDDGKKSIEDAIENSDSTVESKKEENKDKKAIEKKEKDKLLTKKQ